VKEKGKGYWINEIWQQEWNKISIKFNNQVCQMDEKMFMNAINWKIKSSIPIDGWNVTTSNNQKM
jgi:ABC-type transport system substrate-binding protein